MSLGFLRGTTEYVTDLDMVLSFELLIMSDEFAPQSYTEFFIFVIQSEAKDLGNTHFMYMRFFTTLRSVSSLRSSKLSFDFCTNVWSK